jgi:NADPH2:quinone reductase
MRAIRVARTGGPEVLELVELDTPKPPKGEVLVRVEAAGVNFIDIYHRTGAYPHALPFVIGEEGAGVVEAVGENDGRSPASPEAGQNLAPHAAVGDRVAWSSVTGSYATHVTAKAERVVRVPEGVSSAQAAAAMLQGMTAHYLAHTIWPLAPGDTCLVHAAAGGVGLLLVQMAHRAGAQVFGTTSTEEKADLVREAGGEAILRGDQPFDEVVRQRTGGRGVDVVYDSIGAATFEKSLLSLRRRGMLVVFGQSSGRIPPFDLQTLNARGSLFVTRPKLADYVATREELEERAGAVLGAIARDELRVRIHKTYPLEQAAEAQRALESGKTTGKLLLIPDGTSPASPERGRA